ncbi:hypothetical protein [Pedobacter sp. GR22-6]|uniref:hypothetical protein n=1 Tax=Pedobacter sp. GR22-6 TaxID=3127957 RepID=UPI00307DA91B
MNIPIGKYISQKLRSKGILNKDAATFIGLSKSAFEKILAQNDIYGSRLLKLSALLDENLFEYYESEEPIASYRKKELEEYEAKLTSLSERVEQLTKRVLDQEEVIRLLKEKEQFLNPSK